MDEDNTDGFLSSLQRTMIIDKSFAKDDTEEQIMNDTMRRLMKEQNKLYEEWSRADVGVFVEFTRMIYHHIGSLS